MYEIAYQVLAHNTLGGSVRPQVGVWTQLDGAGVTGSLCMITIPADNTAQITIVGTSLVILAPGIHTVQLYFIINNTAANIQPDATFAAYVPSQSNKTASLSIMQIA